MIADHLLNLIEKSLDQLTDVDVAPRDTAYPNRGEKFIRLSAVGVDMRRNEHNIRALVRFKVTSSIRTRKFPLQKEWMLYNELIDLSERTFYRIIRDEKLLFAVRTVFPPPFSVYENFSSQLLDLQVQEVYPDFYGSTDKPSPSGRRVAGFKVEQVFESPVITIPIQCFEFDVPPQEVFEQRIAGLPE